MKPDAGHGRPDNAVNFGRRGFGVDGRAQGMLVVVCQNSANTSPILAVLKWSKDNARRWIAKRNRNERFIQPECRLMCIAQCACDQDGGGGGEYCPVSGA